SFRSPGRPLRRRILSVQPQRCSARLRTAGLRCLSGRAAGSIGKSSDREPCVESRPAATTKNVIVRPSDGTAQRLSVRPSCAGFGTLPVAQTPSHSTVAVRTCCALYVQAKPTRIDARRSCGIRREREDGILQSLLGAILS